MKNWRQMPRVAPAPAGVSSSPSPSPESRHRYSQTPALPPCCPPRAGPSTGAGTGVPSGGSSPKEDTAGALEGAEQGPACLAQVKMSCEPSGVGYRDKEMSLCHRAPARTVGWDPKPAPF